MMQSPTCYKAFYSSLPTIHFFFFILSFIIKTNSSKRAVLRDLEAYIEDRANGMRVIRARYEKAIEEVEQKALTLDDVARLRAHRDVIEHWNKNI